MYRVKAIRNSERWLYQLINKNLCHPVVFAGTVSPSFTISFQFLIPPHFRQFISEFGQADLPVYFLNAKGDHKEYKFGELLPLSFGLEQGQKYLIQ